jgi:hypothetical protein
MKLIFTILFCCLINIGYSQIKKAEYFIDSDPGTELGIDIPVTQGFDVNETFSINTTGLDLGIHKLFVRTKDINDVWSLFFYQTFLVHDFTDTTTPTQIVAAEYFFDSDPGTDDGTEIAITPGFSINETLSILIDTPITDGIHTLYIRTKDEDSRWSLFFKQTFLVHTFTNPVQTQINKAEYFIDTDPGVGLGTEFSITNGFNVDETIAIPTTGLTEDYHYLHIRVRDENGVWSLYEVIEFLVTEALGVEDELLRLTKIYPVPASDYITVESEQLNIESISFMDIYGKTIKSIDVDNPINIIDISNFAEGIYFISIRSDKGIMNKKIIIK